MLTQPSSHLIDRLINGLVRESDFVSGPYCLCCLSILWGTLYTEQVTRACTLKFTVLCTDTFFLKYSQKPNRITLDLFEKKHGCTDDELKQFAMMSLQVNRSKSKNKIKYV